jgi:mannose-6-phosphate isomerase-like protein (cupin superfamily)
MKDWLVGLAEAKAAPIPAGARSALLMKHGTMTLRYYAPRGRDPQTPHEQDEVYVVISGSGTFALGRDEDALERRTFGPGDAIFAPAGWIHRFENFTDDFGTWVVFWGPHGGEEQIDTDTEGPGGVDGCAPGVVEAKAGNGARQSSSFALVID